MELSPNKADANQAIGRRGGRQFSLRSLLLLVLIVCVGAALVGGWRRRFEARARWASRMTMQWGITRHWKVRKVLVDVGLPDDEPGPLTIADPEQAYVSSVQGCGDFVWRFRVYLPPQKQWHLCTNQGTKWDQRPIDFLGSTCCGATGASGELVMDVGIARDIDGVGFIWIQYGGIQYSERGAVSELEEPAIAVVLSNGKGTWRASGYQEQETYSAGERIELLRFHRELGDNADAAAAKPLRNYQDPLKDYGFSIYFEEYVPKL